MHILPNILNDYTLLTKIQKYKVYWTVDVDFLRNKSYQYTGHSLQAQRSSGWNSESQIICHKSQPDGTPPRWFLSTQCHQKISVRKNVQKCECVAKHIAKRLTKHFGISSPSTPLETNIYTNCSRCLRELYTKTAATGYWKTEKIAQRTLQALTLPLLWRQLPGLVCKNATSAIRNGETIIDVIATWVTTKQKTQQDHFKTPHPQLRANILIVKQEKAKGRPLLNPSTLKWEIFSVVLLTP